MVEAKDSHITFVRAYTINDIYVDNDWGEVCFDPFGRMRLSRPDEGRDPRLTDPYVEFFESLTMDDLLEDSTEEEPIIPISSFEIIEGNWWDHTDLYLIEKSPQAGSMDDLFEI